MTAARRCVLACLAMLAACTSAPVAGRRSTPSPTVSSPAQPAFTASNVTAVVAFLAGEIGPREATSPAYRRAGGYVETRFRSFGYRARRQTFRVPGGMSNYAPVQEGDTFNVIAEPEGFDPFARHIVIGAHLDTVPQAPGAVDNAAGVGIVIELARLASLERTPLPIVFVAFGAEEARVPSGGLHGSRAYVSALTVRERRAIRVMVAIDRLGTGSRVPVCTASRSSRALGDRFLAAARRIRVPSYGCTNGTSDHVPFAAAGIAAVRLGPDNFREYHTPRDLPAIFVPAQAERAGALLWEFIRSEKRSG